MIKESINKTLFVDLDGTLLRHLTNDQLDAMLKKHGSRSFMHEKPLKKTVDFLKGLSENDMIVFTTARDAKHKDHTIKVLQRLKIPYDHILFELHSGPRYLVNDMKPVGSVGNKLPYKTAYAINLTRNKGIQEKDKSAFEDKPELSLIT
jgi:hypothetical protein